MILSIDSMSNADKFFGKLNSVLQWNSSRCKSREFLLKRFELGLNLKWQFVRLHRPKVKQVRDCKPGLLLLHQAFCWLYRSSWRCRERFPIFAPIVAEVIDPSDAIA